MIEPASPRAHALAIFLLPALSCLAGLAGIAAPAQAADRPLEASGAPLSLVDQIPARPPGARSGSQFVAYVRGMDGAARERAILAELMGGNIPSLPAQPQEGGARRSGGRPGRAVGDARLSGDRLDEDFVRFPGQLRDRQRGGPPLRLRVAHHHHRRRDLRPGRAAAFAADHDARPGDDLDRLFRAARRQDPPADQRPPARPAGRRAKKDYVVTGRLALASTQEAICGWHRGVGAPIQPLSLVHGSRYADYSHGVRLVAETVYVDGRPRSFCDLLADPQPARLLSREGAIAGVRGILDRFAAPFACPANRAGGSAGSPRGRAGRHGHGDGAGRGYWSNPATCSSGSRGGSSRWLFGSITRLPCQKGARHRHQSSCAWYLSKMNQLPFISVTPSLSPRLAIWSSASGRFMCSAALPLRS